MSRPGYPSAKQRAALARTFQQQGYSIDDAARAMHKLIRAERRSWDRWTAQFGYIEA